MVMIYTLFHLWHFFFSIISTDWMLLLLSVVWWLFFSCHSKGYLFILYPSLLSGNMAHRYCIDWVLAFGYQMSSANRRLQSDIRGQMESEIWSLAPSQSGLSISWVLQPEFRCPVVFPSPCTIVTFSMFQ